MDIYFNIKKYIETTDDTKSSILKNIKEFIQISIDNDEILMINKNNNKNFKSAESVYVAVIDYAASLRRLDSVDVQTLYNFAVEKISNPLAEKIISDLKPENNSEFDNVFDKPRGPLN